MGRKSQHPNGTKIISARLPTEIADWLRGTAQAYQGGLAELLAIIVEKEMATKDTRELITKINFVRKDLDQHRDVVRDLEKQEMLLQARLQEQTHVNQEALTHRYDLLALAVRTGRIADLEKFRCWADAPAGREILPQCRFGSIEDAFSWMTTAPDAISWREDNDPRVRKLQGGSL